MTEVTSRRFESRQQIMESLKIERNLAGADMSGLDLSGIKLMGINMKGADLRGWLRHGPLDLKTALGVCRRSPFELHMHPFFGQNRLISVK